MRLVARVLPLLLAGACIGNIQAPLEVDPGSSFSVTFSVDDSCEGGFCSRDGATVTDIAVCVEEGSENWTILSSTFTASGGSGASAGGSGAPVAYGPHGLSCHGTTLSSGDWTTGTVTLEIQVPADSAPGEHNPSLFVAYPDGGNEESASFEILVTGDETSTCTGACVYHVGGDDRTDADCDAWLDGDDNCADDGNTDQADADLDGQGDVCDALPNDDGQPECAGACVYQIGNESLIDTDCDGWLDTDDNCDTTANVGQAPSTACDVG
jgi:hypothetical protein